MPDSHPRPVNLAAKLSVLPEGIRHRPVGQAEVHVLLIETAGTPNTGDPATAAANTEI